MLRAIAVVLVLAPIAVAGDAQDFVYLGAEPVFLRLRVLVDGKDHRTPFTTWLRSVFDRLDADKDGRLSPDEAKAFPAIAEFRSAESNPAGRPAWKQDPDENGFIEFEEMVTAVENGAGPALQMRMASSPDPSVRFRGQQGADPQRIFKHLDADKDGRLTTTEIETVRTALRKFDRDDDDTVSAEEISSSNPYAIYFASEARATKPPTLPFLELSAGELSGKAIRQFFQRYDRNEANGASDLMLAPEELPIPASVFKAHDANGDGRLDFDEVPVLLKQMEPQVEFTLYISVQWDRTPAIDFVCHDDRWKDRVRRSFSGDVTIDFGDAQLEFSVPAGNQFDTTQFLEQQFKGGDTDNNGYIEQKELRSNYYMNQLFARADADKDGKLFLKELREHVSGRQQAGLSRTVVDLADAGRSLFEILDVNRDRRLSPTEVNALGYRARAWDSDKDGALGEAEVPQHFRLTARRGSAQIPGLNFVVNPVAPFAPNFVNRNGPGPTWYTRMDRNSDGEVTPREFLGPPELFARLDLNGDGALDVTEAQAAQK